MNWKNYTHINNFIYEVNNQISYIYFLEIINIYQKGFDLEIILLKELMKYVKEFRLINFFNLKNKKYLNIIRNKINKFTFLNHYSLKNSKRNFW